jgi:mercuric ion transport protein
MKAGAENIVGGRDKNLVKTGAIGTAIMAVCCFTPVLVIGLGAVGLSAWLGWLDFVLIPGLLIFMCLLGFGLWRLKST